MEIFYEFEQFLHRNFLRFITATAKIEEKATKKYTSNAMYSVSLHIDIKDTLSATIKMFVISFGAQKFDSQKYSHQSQHPLWIILVGTQ